MIYVSATPQEWELSNSQGHVVEQLIRPTGLLDPEVELRRTEGQIEDLIIEILHRKQLGQRTIVTTLTKKMAEALTEYLNDEEKILKLVQHFKDQSQIAKDQIDPERIIRGNEQLPIEDMPIGPIEAQYYSIAHLGNAEAVLSDSSLLPKVAYLHSDIVTLERSDILDDLRRGTYDVVVGINLLREGLDLPEVTLVAILDADKEGFLRSRSSLIQTMGRAARHTAGKAILYADKLTLSMQAAINETNRRRNTQIAYNQTHGIQPITISKPIRDRMIEKKAEDETSYFSKNAQPGYVVQLSKKESLNLDAIKPSEMTPQDKKMLIPKLRRRMNQAANDMDFELAAILRDHIRDLEA
jgi:excinuclease UvrABC helicase subunit UvrB